MFAYLNVIINNYIIRHQLRHNLYLLSDCHYFWTNFSNYAIRLISFLWLCCVIVMFAMFIWSYYKFRNLLTQRLRAHQKKMRMSNNDMNKANVNIPTDSVHKSGQANQSFHNSKRSNGGENSLPRRSSSPLLKSVKKNLFYNFLIAVIFVIGLAPVIILALVISFPQGFDSVESSVDQSALIPFIILPATANFVNSVLLCTNHSGLSSAIKQFVRAIITCSCLRKKR